jgi:hypothetical protein
VIGTLLGALTPPQICDHAISPIERKRKFPDVWDSLRFVDPEENFTADTYRYEIGNLPKDPQVRKSPEHPDEELLWPIVVRPPTSAETSFP